MSADMQQWPWQRLNQSNAYAHETLGTLLDPQPGERWLDIGTGGGGLAFALARGGADVVGVDVSEEGLEHARREADERGLAAEFQLGDAQDLPFEDAAFDGVASAFGVIFAPDQLRAAAELARVCRTGGKLGLALMPMESRVAEVLTMLRRFGGGPPTHPATWSERVDELLGGSFELDLQRRESAEPPPPRMPWDETVRSFAQVRAVVERLDEEQVAELRSELEGVFDRYGDRKPTYVVVVGRRR